MGSLLRQHPRFIDHQKVEVAISDRAELHQLWTVDISKGGMFLETDTPPELGAQLEIKLATPHGHVQLRGRVVHVVDLATAKAFGQPPGVGVQFIDLQKEVSERIARYVDGLADSLSGDLSVDLETEPLEVLLEEARRVLTALNASDLYGAVGVAPSASPEQIQDAITDLCLRFAHPPPECPPPKAARLVQLTKQLERTAAFFSNPLRRLHYDFKQGHLRVKERVAAGEDREHLRQVWSDALPERVTKAKEIAKRALALEQAGQLEECVRVAAEALELDPFNAELERVLEGWRKGERSSPLVAVAQATGDDPSQVMQELLDLGKRMSGLDHFGLLGLASNASTQDIARAYMQLSRRYDPEALRGRVPQSVLSIAADYHRLIGIAYKTLSDGVQRRQYASTAKPSPASSGNEAELARTRNGMGIVFLRKSDYRQARQLFQEAIDLAPQIVEYQANLAWAMIADADFDRKEAASKAKPMLLAAIDKTPGTTPDAAKRSAKYHYYLGRLLREQGDANTAADHFERAVDLDARLTEAATELRLINMRKRKR